MSGRELSAHRGRFWQRWSQRWSVRTQHLADVGLDVNILEVLEGVGVKQAQSGIQPDGHPDAVSHPGQLAHLALFARMGVEGLLLTGRQIETVRHEKKAQLKTCLKGVVLHLYSHGLGLDDVNLVPVSTPHLVVHHRHTAD